ncbi:hypothetical protein CR513_41237, partial [Mucuna pruriens]
MKQLATSNLEISTISKLQQYTILAKHDRHHPGPQDANRTASKYCDRPAQATFPLNPFRIREGMLVHRSRSQPKPTPKQLPTRSHIQRQLSHCRFHPDSDKELLKMFRKVEINIPLLDAIKQIPKYAKFLKELCVHKRRKMKGTLPKKCRDPGIFSVPCTIGECTFVDAMLDPGASINIMPASTYRSLNFGDLEPTGMTIQLANRSSVQPLEVLEDVLVQVNELIFLADFYMLDMENKTSGKEETLILGRPFLMTARTKINVHARTLSMEFGDTLVQFNIFEAMKHPTEDHSLFGIDMIEELVEEYFQLDNCSADEEDFAGIAESSSCSKADYDESDYSDIADLAIETELTKLLNQVCNPKSSECTNNVEVKVVETKKASPAQLATIFTAETKPLHKKSKPTPIRQEPTESAEAAKG